MKNTQAESRTASDATEVDFERLTDELGGMGRYQIIVYFLACLMSLLTGTTAVIIVFTAYISPHRCFIHECDNEDSSYDEYFVNFSIPYNDKYKKFNSCYFYGSAESNPYSNQSCSVRNFDIQKINKCTDFIFDTETMSSTFVSTFKLVCDRAYLAPLGGSIYMAGNLVGSPIIGLISDMFGRKVGLLISTLLFSLGGIASIFSPSYPFFLLFTFITGAGAIGCFQVAFVIGIEFIGTKWRTFCGIMINIPFAFGEASSGILAYFFRDWKWLVFSCTAPVLLMISYQWIFPESVRWLVSKNRIEEAVKLVDKMAETNKLSSPSYLLKNNLENGKNLRNEVAECLKSSERKSMLNIIRYPNMRKKTLLLCFCWTVCSMSYYGLSANSGNLSGNLFANYILLMLIEVPSYVGSYFLFKIIGRKGTLMSIFLLAGAASLLSGLLPSDLKLYVVLLSLLGKFGIAGAFGSIFVYTAELYPTEYRGVGLGICSSAARIGSILAPIVASLARIYLPLPLLIFGLLSFAAGLLILLLPETLGSELQQTLEESEKFGQDQSIWYFVCRLPKNDSKSKNSIPGTEEI